MFANEKSIVQSSLKQLSLTLFCIVNTKKLKLFSIEFYLENNKLQDKTSKILEYQPVKKIFLFKNHKTDIAAYLHGTKLINKTVECKNETTTITKSALLSRNTA